MLILALILFGMVIGAGAQLILGREDGRVNWGLALGSGLIGSFVGGLLVSLISGDGIEVRPSGIIGSLVGAVLVTAAWRWWTHRTAAAG
ncbi:MAG: GlsB/YeaQ/YmgE family stress response membrane protein [Nocardioidaceae bacterium]|nr:GlsB/YeaQ/YmgE family stress response membrane protein [Nocardioidaceae bacterium]